MTTTMTTRASFSTLLLLALRTSAAIAFHRGDGSDELRRQLYPTSGRSSAAAAVVNGTEPGFNATQENGDGDSGDDPPISVALVNTVVYFILIFLGLFVLYAHVSGRRIFRFCGCGIATEEETAVEPTATNTIDNRQQQQRPRRSKATRRKDIRAKFQRLKLEAIVAEDDFKDITVHNGNDESEATGTTMTVPDKEDEDNNTDKDLHTDIETGANMEPANNSPPPPPTRLVRHFRRRSSGILLNLKSKGVTANNCCAICLDSYHSGDHIVMSNNPKCPHVYHVDCLVEYFASSKVHDGDTPCPFCRQAFCILTDEDDDEDSSEEVVGEEGNTSNVEGV